ncbi:26200_t:CDS:2, partial [Racocetra persica]
NKDKYIYKKRLSNEKTKGASKKKRLNQVSNIEEISSSSSTENNGESLTNKLEKLFNFPLDSFISKELKSSKKSSEINNAQKTYFEESNKINNKQKTYFEENKEVLFDYLQGFEQLFSMLSEYSIFGLDSSNQLLLTSYGFNEWQSTENLKNPSMYAEESTKKFKNPSAITYEEYTTKKLESPSEMIDGDKSTEKLVDSVLMGML